MVLRNKTNGDKVTVKDAMSSTRGYNYIGSIEFADGTKWDAAYIQGITREPMETT